MNKSIEENYASLAKEVETFRNKVVNNLQNNESGNSLYKGCTIMYSSLLENPSFLFIGINPGGVRNKETGLKIEEGELNIGDGFEYINSEGTDWDYTLARQTRNLFEQAELYDKLKDSVKTNVFYFMTSNEPELWQLFDSFDEELNNQFKPLAYKWTKQMIEMVNPKIIICEGISALNKVAEIYQITPKRKDSYGYFEVGNIFVFGYSRFRSFIKYKPLVADFLKKEAKKRLVE
jgi:hypothetical protein